MNRRNFLKRCSLIPFGLAVVANAGASKDTSPSVICRPKPAQPGLTLTGYGSPTVHKKVYHTKGTGCSLMCGNNTIMSSTSRDINWAIESCPFCSMYVSTHGCNPDTNVVIELDN